MFDFSGHPLSSINVFKYVGTGASAPLAVAKVETAEVTVNLGEKISLPEKLKVTYNDNSTSSETVTWDEADVAKVEAGEVGTYTVKGTVSVLDTVVNVTCKVTINPKNLVVNPSFEDSDRSMWVITYPDGYDESAGFTKDDPLTGSYSLHFWSSSDIDFTVSQEIKGIESGVYKLTANIQGGDAETQDMSLTITVGDKTYTAPMSVSGWKNWDTPVIEDIEINAGDEVVISAHVSASAGAWGTLDDFVLYKTGDLGQEETPSEPETPSEEETPSETETPSSTTTETTTTSTTTSTTTTQPSKQETPKSDDMVITMQPTEDVNNSGLVNIGLSAQNAVLKEELVSQFYGQDKCMMVHLGNGIGFSIEPDAIDKSLVNVNLSASLNKLEQFAVGFDSFHMQPIKESRLAHKAGIHLNLGVEYEGSVAYIFIKDMELEQYKLADIRIVNEIGNVAISTDEFTDIMVLIAK
jgi:arabinogalactan endo-1,4-beta-galactosidase